MLEVEGFGLRGSVLEIAQNKSDKLHLPLPTVAIGVSETTAP